MIKYRQLHVGSDCTGPYEVTISLPMTVREFISELLETYPNEWGCIGIYKNGEPFLCDYQKGKLVDTIPEEYMDMQIESVTGSGGWGRSDYSLHIKEEQKIGGDEKVNKLLKLMDDAIKMADSKTAYAAGVRSGIGYCKSLIDNSDEEPGKINKSAVRLTNLAVMVRLLTIEELLELIKIIGKELSKRREIKAESAVENGNN